MILMTIRMVILMITNNDYNDNSNNTDKHDSNSNDIDNVW